MIETETTVDNIGGWHPDPAIRKWDPGSCFECEGRHLYGIVREMKPKVIVEVGTFYGTSATWMALACKHNGFGKVYSIDNWQTIGEMTGSGIPADLRPFVELIRSDIFTFDWRKAVGLPVDLLLEDGQHSWNFTENVLKMFIGLKELAPFKIICHDWFNFDCQQTVHAEGLKVLGEPTRTFIESPSDCGYAEWDRTR